MRYIHNFFVTIVISIIAISSFGIQQAFAESYISQIGPKSTHSYIEKLQHVFEGLGLYEGEIDGKYASIEDKLIDYQLENNIVDSKDHDHAGYFGKKTIASLEENYGDTFSQLQNKYLQFDIPEKGTPITFEATAYYSALPNQEEYYRGTYEAEIRLQGNGTHTASGTAPHVGTIAAPKGYSFGTKIYIEGYGVGVVEDRGGAIHGNRIDIWMGTGDEGRRRALAWGRRTITGYIVEGEDEITLEFEEGGFFKESKEQTEEELVVGGLTQKKKRLAESVVREIHKVLKEQTDSEEEYTEQIQVFKDYIANNLIAKHREEEVKKLLRYVVEIL